MAPGGSTRSTSSARPWKALAGTLRTEEFTASPRFSGSDHVENGLTVYTGETASTVHIAAPAIPAIIRRESRVSIGISPWSGVPARPDSRGPAAAMTHGSASETRRVQATGKVGRPSACGAMRSIAAFLGGGVRFDSPGR